MMTNSKQTRPRRSLPNALARKWKTPSFGMGRNVNNRPKQNKQLKGGRGDQSIGRSVKPHSFCHVTCRSLSGPVCSSAKGTHYQTRARVEFVEFRVTHCFALKEDRRDHYALLQRRSDSHHLYRLLFTSRVNYLNCWIWRWKQKRAGAPDMSVTILNRPGKCFFEHNIRREWRLWWMILMDHFTFRVFFTHIWLHFSECHHIPRSESLTH